MSFSLKVKKGNANQLSELANFQIWQKTTFIDNTEEIKAINPIILPLESTDKMMQVKNVIMRKRENNYILYTVECYNSLGITIVRSTAGAYYFQFRPNDSDLPNLYNIRSLEYSIDQNFAKTLTNVTFHKEFTFEKVSEINYPFFIQAEDNTKYYEKTLIPFFINDSGNAEKIVKHSLEFIELPEGFYNIDGSTYFFDAFNEVMPSHYILKITV